MGCVLNIIKLGISNALFYRNYAAAGAWLIYEAVPEQRCEKVTGTKPVSAEGACGYTNKNS